jgi:hypothetical protein
MPPYPVKWLAFQLYDASGQLKKAFYKTVHQ